MHAGIEDRISVLFRGRGMRRALVEGHEHFELLVGAAALRHRSAPNRVPPTTDLRAQFATVNRTRITST